MELRSRIGTNHQVSHVYECADAEQYIADFTERTKLLPIKRHVEVHANCIPTDPNTGADMDCLKLNNESSGTIEYILLDDNSFFNINGTNVEHCEGSFSIKQSMGVLPKWIVLFEIKDCLPENVSNYIEKARGQIMNVKFDYDARGIIGRGINVYGIVSCPQKKVGFNAAMFTNPIDALNWKRVTGISYYLSNELFVVSENMIRPIPS